ncbi:unnamed protein product [Thlaspi arvense]|uniref:Uncharacterized protein n=1 Tax=Thlaspi arvense TaxID=13288 RepID=A0AAU9RC44_THLAR|nr:unnamed protein product [Thlaspi arvense]
MSAEYLKSVTRVSDLRGLSELLENKTRPVVVAISGRVGSRAPLKCQRSGVLGVFFEKKAKLVLGTRTLHGDFERNPAEILLQHKEVPWFLEDSTGQVNVVGAQYANGFYDNLKEFLFDEPASELVKKLVEPTSELIKKSVKPGGFFKVLHSFHVFAFSDSPRLKQRSDILEHTCSGRVLELGKPLTIVGEAVRYSDGALVIKRPRDGSFMALVVISIGLTAIGTVAYAWYVMPSIKKAWFLDKSKGRPESRTGDQADAMLYYPVEPNRNRIEKLIQILNRKIIDSIHFLSSSSDMGLHHYWWVMTVVVIELFFYSSNSQNLRLESNRFSGEIPSGFDKCALLEQLSLGGNDLSGNIPEDLFRLQRLNLLGIQENALSGTLSPALGNLSGLVRFDISWNTFSGEIPDVFNTLPELKYLVAQANRFAGGVPRSLSSSRNLILLNLRNNSLSGPWHLDCAAMTNLTSLDLGSNNFNASLLGYLPSCRHLKYMNLAQNHFDGELPQSFEDLHSLSYLSLSNCSLVNISSTLRILERCKNLTTLVLAMNFYGEMLPDDLNLRFKKLEVLAFGNSNLTGTVPGWLTKSTNLQLLDLSWNHLSGAIPNWIGGFSSLFYLDLSRNSLTGEIPRSLTMLPSLSEREPTFLEPPPNSPFFYNNVNARALQYKHVHGFPPTIQLGQNNLSGPIWKAFGNLKKLHVFDLNSNMLSGSIPGTLSRMESLETLDLSNNRISGSIPASLERLTFLSKFSVANNSLSGNIPSGGQFMTFPNSSFEGNHLAGDHCLQCPGDTPDEKRSRVSDSDRDNDTALDFSYGLALGFGLSLVLVAFRRQLFMHHQG